MSEKARYDQRPVLVGIRSAAGMLDRSPASVRRLIRAGALRTVKDNDSLMIPVTEIDAYVEGLKRNQWKVVNGRSR